MTRKKPESKDTPSDEELLLISLFNEMLQRDPTDLEKSKWLAAMLRPDVLTTESVIRYTLSTKAGYKKPVVKETLGDVVEKVEDSDSE